jgi:hypothetical protein
MSFSKIQLSNVGGPTLVERANRGGNRKGRRWGTRNEAMAYGKIGPTRLNELMQAKLIIAKKNGVKVLVDLDSLDDYYDSLPDAADVTA